MPTARSFSALAIASILLAVTSCSTQKHVGSLTIIKTKTLLATCDKGWLKFRIYQLPLDSQKPETRARHHSLVFSIMIINTENGVSPLRRICSNLQQYNILYEYLLNQAKNDLAVVSGTDVIYPSYFFFENNYNAFPFETLNVGFSAEALAGHKFDKSVPVKLLYLDKVFAHDTLTCDISKAI